MPQPKDDVDNTEDNQMQHSSWFYFVAQFLYIEIPTVGLLISWLLHFSGFSVLISCNKHKIRLPEASLPIVHLAGDTHQTKSGGRLLYRFSNQLQRMLTS